MFHPSTRISPAVGMSAGIFDRREQVIGLPNIRQQIIVHVRKVSMIARNEIQGNAVRRHNNTVRAMFTRPVQLPDQGDLVKLIVPIQILYPVQSASHAFTCFRMMVHHRSEEHTSELQSLLRITYAVFSLKKKTNQSRAKLLHTPP